MNVQEVLPFFQILGALALVSVPIIGSFWYMISVRFANKSELADLESKIIAWNNDHSKDYVSISSAIKSLESKIDSIPGSKIQDDINAIKVATEVNSSNIKLLKEIFDQQNQHFLRLTEFAAKKQ